MNVNELIQLLNQENGNEEVFIDIKYFPYLGETENYHRYDLVAVKNGKHTVILEVDYFKEVEE